MDAGSVGFAELADPLRGPWPFPQLPEQVALLGRTFTRSRTWAAPRAGVRAQYREDRDTQAMHLMVLENGTYLIDHVDDANPERGRVLEHAFKDAVHTPVGALVLLGLVVAGVAGVSWLATR